METSSPLNTSQIEDFPEDAPSVRNLLGQFENLRNGKQSPTETTVHQQEIKLIEIVKEEVPARIVQPDQVVQDQPDQHSEGQILEYLSSHQILQNSNEPANEKSTVEKEKIDHIQISQPATHTIPSSLEGKSVLITGSTAGIGFGAARAFAEAGCRVWINGRTEERVNAAIQMIKSEFPQAHLNGIAADVGTESGVQEIAKFLPDVDILVNNTGIYEQKNFYEISDEDWIKFFTVNVLSGVRVSRLYLKGMLERNWGRIIFVSSESAVLIQPDMVHYGMTKISQIGVAKGLAALTQGTNVTVNVVLPGPTKTEGVMEAAKKMLGKEEISEQEIAELEKPLVTSMRPTSLIQRLLTIDEVANAITYLASPKASGTNGASLPVEGGLLRCIP